jgi:hypothetical protein
MQTLIQPQLHGVANPGSCQAPVLVVAHPGHELRVHGWLEAARPLVCVLTDGSGSTGEGRIESTAGLLARTDARTGAVFGRMSDREVYAAILDGRAEEFIALADDLAALLVRHGADCVVGDAVEGYNPSHDLCRLVINTAVRMAASDRGAPLGCYDFLLVGSPADCPEALRGEAYWLRLDEDALARKLASARGYPELAGEVDAALARWGSAPFAIECLRPVDPGERYGWPEDEKPYYETYGEKRVAEGIYPRVLRFRDHVMPIADALWSHGERHA